MATTETSIVNDALALVGADRITSLDDDTPVALLFREQYAKTRDALLEAHPWRFAIKRATLAQSTTTPDFLYAYYYVLPSDCLRVIETDSNDIPWEREGRLVATDASALSIRYIAQITQPGLFSANFAKALAARLAAENCYAITQSVELKKTLSANAEQALAEARSFSAQEASSRQPYAKQWLNSRY